MPRAKGARPQWHANLDVGMHISVRPPGRVPGGTSPNGTRTLMWEITSARAVQAEQIAVKEPDARLACGVRRLNGKVPA
jgi:hypothetical protein